MGRLTGSGVSQSGGLGAGPAWAERTREAAVTGRRPWLQRLRLVSGRSCVGQRPALSWVLATGHCASGLS